MKKLILSFASVVIFSTAPALAADKAATKAKAGAPSTTPASSYRSPSGDVGTSGAGSRLGLGFATFGTLGILPASTVLPAMSAWYDMDPRMSLQALLGVNSSDPFTFGAGAVFRYTLHGSQANGFHGGIGFNLGTMSVAAASKFFLNIFPALGMHFSLGGHVSNLQLSFDGGPIFAITPSPFQFGMNTFGGIAGASIHYFF